MLKRILMLMVVLVLVLGFSTAFAADEITVTGTDATANSASENVSQTVSRPSAEVQAQTSNVIMTEAEKTDPSKIFPGVESTNSSISVALPAEIQILIQNGKLLQARTELLKLWNATTDPALKDESEIALSDVNSRLLFSANENFPGMIEYRVKPGDSLYIIAKKNKTSAHMIQMINGLKSDMIHPGQKLKVLPGNFSITVSKKHNVLRLLLADQLFKRYRCATGATPDLTPEGTFVVTTKLENPTWYKMGSKAIPPGGSDNLLGTRWLGISKQGYGIHGTTVPESIGKHATSGCVRMLNGEVEELYDMVPPGTKVTIIA